HIIPIEYLTGKTDLFHTSDWLEPPAGCPKITTVHDMAIFKYPETFSPRGGHDIVGNLKRKLRWVKKESRMIIAVSENTKKDIVDILNIPEEKIRVIYEAAAPVFNRPVEKETAAAVKRKYEISGPYILAVGTREPRKNLGRVVEAYEMLAEKHDISLIIAGKKGWGGERLKAPRPRLGLAEGGQGSRLKAQKIKTLGFVEKEELAALYAGAECFVYPSLYEGFGLPVLEAMTCGCPVVTSNAGSLSEVGGEAAIYVNPLSSEDIAGGIKKALEMRNGDEFVRLKEKMREQAGKFSWERCAKETLAVYKECAAL
ncbi:MAG: glycosyltransferase family 1 protein, partial [bacterium]|nr:glycosyltransferase family 1 protein [bacterium]